MKHVPSSCFFLCAVVATAASAQEHLPTAADLEAARQSQALASQLIPRIKALTQRCDAFERDAERAGITMEGTTFHLTNRDRPPSEAAVKALEAQVPGLSRDAAGIKTDCEKWSSLQSRIEMSGGAAAEIDACRNWYASTGKKADCSVWKKLEAEPWPGDAACADVAERAEELAELWTSFTNQELKPAQATTQRKAKAEALYLQPVSGSPRERAIVIPRSFSSGDRLDTLKLFAAVHPSHFVFLRHDVSEAPRDAMGNVPERLSRTLKKGEAVLTTRQSTLADREVAVLSLDGNSGVLSVEDLALAPLPGTRPVPLTAADLNVYDDKGRLVAGPIWLQPDATGFSLDEPNAWLDLLEPQEPRVTKFLEAKEKTLSCYQKQRARLDPSGTLSQYYDIVTFGRSGNIQKVEPAAQKFDRTACGVCGCKAFNALKASYIKAAIEPAQKKAFEKYRPVIEQLSRTDFAAASRGAPRGPSEHTEDQPL